MNYGDHNFIEITKQTKLRVALVVSSASSQSSSSTRASRAVLFDNVDTAKMHPWLNTSKVLSRVESCRVEPSGIWAIAPRKLEPQGIVAIRG